MKPQRLFPLRCSPLLLLLLLLPGGCRCQSITSSSSSSSSSSPPPPQSTTTTTTSSSSPDNRHEGQASTWSENIVASVESLFGALAEGSSSGKNGSGTGVSDLVSRLPGILQGLGGVGVGGVQGGNDDVGQVLASLFADPRTQNIPAWIEALLKGDNSSSQALANSTQQLLHSFEQQGTDQKLQTMLANMFPDVLQGLSSLHLSPNSSPEDVVAAILNDPSLMSSLSTIGMTMLRNLSGGMGLQTMLKQQFPVDPNSQCAADLNSFAQSLMKGEMWALQMLDAMGKLLPGVLKGSNTFFGDYDECSSISFTDQSHHNIEGLFCGMAVKSPGALAKLGQPVLGLHLCLPSSCNEVQRYFLIQPTLQSIGSEYYGQYCYRSRDPSDDGRFIAAVTIFAVLAALCAVGTFHGVRVDHKPETKPPQNPPQAAQPYVTHVNQAYVLETKPEDTAVAQTGCHVPVPLTNRSTDSVSDEKSVLPPPPYSKIEASTSTAQPGGSKEHDSDPVPVTVPVTETHSKPKESLGSKVLLSFSVLKNGRKVLACGQSPSDISCLHGIRVLSITWVVMGHCYSQLGNAQGNKTATVDLLSHFTYAVFPAALLSVDTFFLLSGCLTAFLFLKATRKSGVTPASFILYYVHRIWRLTPLYALVLAYYIGIFPYTKRGPFENLQGMDSENACRENWFYNLLYVNNVIDDKMEKLCLGWSWYLANDMQFTFIAPVILIPWAMKRRTGRVGEVFGCLVAFALIVVHSVSSGVLSYRDELSMFKNTGEYFDKIYLTPWCRVGPYAVGLLLGFILYKTPRDYKMDRMTVMVGWVLAWAVGLTLAYINYDNLKDLAHGIRWNAGQMAAFESLAKWVWAVCVGWVIFACYTGYGGFINTLLSWSAWAPLSRLTYGVYLVHLVVLSTLTGNHKTLFYLDGWTGTELTLAVTVLSFWPPSSSPC
ncbi:O-acyltransferase like protein-like [Babylonia areolata]|uniref:O-acyltransferase like protein-like n=1 Tax=Babylonia areolata TaxID=304850 RepID=UPI003FCFE679